MVKYVYRCIKFLLYKILLWQSKVVSTISIFTIKIKLLKNYEKCFLFYQKSSFCPQDFQTFVFSSSFLFFFLGKCWFFGRTWLMINSKLVVYYMEKIAVEKFGCLKVNFCLLQWQGDSLAYSVLITALFLIRSINYLESWIEIGSKSLAKHIIRIWT